MASASPIGWTPIERLDILVFRRRAVSRLRAIRLVSPTGVEATLLNSRSLGTGDDVVPVVSIPVLKTDLGLQSTACVVDPCLVWIEDDGATGVRVPVWGLSMEIDPPGSGLPGLRWGVRRSVRRARITELPGEDSGWERAAPRGREWLQGDHWACLTRWSLPASSGAVPARTRPAPSRLATGTVPLCREARDETIAG